MTQTFTFVCARHEEYDGNGWRLKSQPDFDPLSGMAVAHDCLEHFNDSADPADEFQALGASMWIRNEDYHYRSNHGITNPGSHIASDMPEIIRHIIHEGYGLPDAPRTRATDEDLEGYIATMFPEYAKELKYMEGRDAREMRITADRRRAITSYLRIGHRRAAKRYKGRNWEAQQIFTQIETTTDKHLKYAEEGAELTVTVDFAKLTARIDFEEYPGYEDDYDNGEETEDAHA